MNDKITSALTETTRTEVLDTLRDSQAAITAMPDTGSVLRNPKTCLSVAVKEDSIHIAGLRFARIFTAAERRIPAQVRGLDCRISDGADNPFYLYDIRTAKRLALANIDTAIKAIEAN